MMLFSDVQLWLGCVESRGMEGGGCFGWFGTSSRSGNFGTLDWGERACGEMVRKARFSERKW
jgi:hypothetical protein